MTSSVLPWIESLPSWVLTYCLHSTICLGAAWIVDRYWIRSEGAREWLWKGAALAGCVTVLIQAGLGTRFEPPTWRLESGRQATPTTSSPELDASRSSTTQAADGPAASATLTDPLRFQDPPEQRQDAFAVGAVPGATLDANADSRGSVDRPRGDPAPTEPAGRLAPWNTCLLVSIWSTILLGCGLSGYLLARLVRTPGVLRVSRVVRGGIAWECLEQLRVRAGIRRRVELLQTERLAEPIAFGLWKWRIVIPSGCEHDLSREELEALLAHELAHLVRYDILWVWIGQLICSGLVFQPLNLVARARWRRAAEFECDRWAVDRQIDRFALARCLMRVATWKQELGGLGLALTATQPRSALSARIETLVAKPAQATSRHPWWSRQAIAASGALLTGCLVAFGPQIRVGAGPVSLAPVTSLGEARTPGGPAEFREPEDEGLRQRGDGKIARQQLAEVFSEVQQLRRELELLQEEVKDTSPWPVMLTSIETKLQRLSMLQARLEALDAWAKHWSDDSANDAVTTPQRN